VTTAWHQRFVSIMQETTRAERFTARARYGLWVACRYIGRRGAGFVWRRAALLAVSARTAVSRSANFSCILSNSLFVILFTLIFGSFVLPMAAGRTPPAPPPGS
jgi:hypothetical protein